ncbi:hypothetical protein B0675_40090 [Streptomyces sp. M41(2017)]|nr:hypothetical protein B0675_40090 [Streptomyces sp. M41(2017)]
MFVEAVDTAGFLLDVVALWIAGLTAAALLLLLLAGLAAVKAWRAVMKGSTGAQAAPQSECDSSPTEPLTGPHTPAWAHTEKEAA